MLTKKEKNELLDTKFAIFVKKNELTLEIEDLKNEISHIQTCADKK